MRWSFKNSRQQAAPLAGLGSELELKNRAEESIKLAEKVFEKKEYWFFSDEVTRLLRCFLSYPIPSLHVTGL